MKHDFERIRREYPLPDIIAQAGIALRKNGREYEALCPFHGEKTPSFQVYPSKSGHWQYHCKGCGAHGDVLNFVTEWYRCDGIGGAVDHLTGEAPRQSNYTPASLASDPYRGYEIGCPPADAPSITAGEKTPLLLNPKRIDPNTGHPKYVSYRPSMVFPYSDEVGHLLGYVLRVDFDDKKITPQIVWMKNADTGFEGWSHGALPDPRPMYGLPDLVEAPGAQVLLVEGEKCRDAAKRLMTGTRVLTASWAGGGKSIRKTDWTQLHGRSVLIWPDNDQEGTNTAIGFVRPDGKWSPGLVELAINAGAKSVKVMTLKGIDKPKGWDIADAEKEMSAADIHALMKERLRPFDRGMIATYRARKEREHGTRTERRNEDRTGAEDVPQVVPDDGQSDAIGARDVAAPASPMGDDAGARAADDERIVRGHRITKETWKRHMLLNEDGGIKSTSPQNAALVLEFEDNYSGVFAWNDFAKEAYVMRRPIWEDDDGSEWNVRKIQDNDVTRCAMSLEFLRLSIKRNDMGAIIQSVAAKRQYNNVRDTLNALEWDGHPRLLGGEYGLEHYAPWLSKYFGVQDNAINRAFGAKWMVGAVARAMEPGCKVDTMLIIEGEQGIRKSSAIRILAEAIAPNVFTDEISQIGSKDAGIDMQGVWIIEIAELDALGKAEVNAIKAWMTRRVDRFRRPYGKHAEDFPRTCVFAGTVNPLADSGYLKDATGGRRFWPVAAKFADTDALKEDARQLWAEAVHLYRKGYEWWLTPAEEKLASQVQSDRYEVDPYADMIDDYLTGRTAVGINDVLGHLEIPKERRTPQTARRVISQLARHGWKLDRQRGVYKSPVVLDVAAE